MDLLTGMRLFTRVADTGNFTAVARELGTTQPSISRMVAALETHLGVRLLNRSSRAVTLTDDGRLFYERAQRALDAVADAERAVGRRRAMPTGLLRLGTPVAFGRLHVAPRMGAFLSRYPEVDVELVMNDAFVDLVGEGLDLAVRVGDLSDPSLIARRIGTTRRVTVASQDYVRRHGAPTVPADLAAHDCILYTRLASGRTWHFEGRTGPIAVDVRGRFAADNSEAVREAVLAGLGIAVVPVWLFPDNDEHQVSILLRDFEPKQLPIHAVYSSRRHLSAKVRAMIDFLTAEFARVPTLATNGPPAPAAADQADDDA
ncbi:MAG: LysR family transcriptional regulator [Acetobacteraceae bacterium]